MKNIGELNVFIEERFKYIEEQFRSRDDSMKLQAGKYEDRLMALNGEAGRLAKQLENSVSPDKFDGKINEINNRIGQTNDKVQLLNDWKSQQSGVKDNRVDIQKVVLFVISIILAITSIWAGFFKS